MCLALLIVFRFIVNSGFFILNDYLEWILFISLVFELDLFIFITTFIEGLSFVGNICLVQ